MADDRTALFVRVPTALATDLDERSRASGRSKQDLVSELLAADGPDDSASRGRRSDVLDLEGVAAMLRVDPAEVMQRVAAGDFPARRFGVTWRFSRSAVLDWLDGNDPIEDRPTGFPTSGV